MPRNEDTEITVVTVGFGNDGSEDTESVLLPNPTALTRAVRLFAENRQTAHLFLQSAGDRTRLHLVQKGGKIFARKT